MLAKGVLENGPRLAKRPADAEAGRGLCGPEAVIWVTELVFAIPVVQRAEKDGHRDAAAVSFGYHCTDGGYGSPVRIAVLFRPEKRLRRGIGKCQVENTHGPAGPAWRSARKASKRSNTRSETSSIVP